MVSINFNRFNCLAFFIYNKIALNNIDLMLNRFHRFSCLNSITFENFALKAISKQASKQASINHAKYVNLVQYSLIKAILFQIIPITFDRYFILLKNYFLRFINLSSTTSPIFIFSDSSNLSRSMLFSIMPQELSDFLMPIKNNRYSINKQF